MAIVYLMHGFIGAGKTTFAKKFEEKVGAIRYTHDEWMHRLYGDNPPADLFDVYYKRVYDLILERAAGDLARGHDVILDFGFWKRSGRDSIRNWADNIGARIHIFSFPLDVEIQRKRTVQRSSDLPQGDLNVDDNAFQLFLPQFEPLAPDEIDVYVTILSHDLQKDTECAILGALT